MDEKPADSAHRHAEDLLRIVRKELERADSKAAILLAGCGVVIAALLHCTIDGKGDTGSLPDTVQWLWWTGTAGIGAGIIALGRAIFPRKKRRHDPTRLITYYGDVAATRRTVLESRLARDVEDIRAITNDQLHDVSAIVATKYHHIRCALWLFALSTTAIATDIVLRSLTS